MVIVLIIVFAVVVWLLKRKSKKISLPDVTMITGGVKTGKSTLAIYLARKAYNKALFRWKFSKLWAKITKKPVPEKPLFYSNIPVGWEFVLVTSEILLRRKRINFKSVMYISEASLIADNMDFKDGLKNENLKLFNKLYGHETHGGKLFYDTQAVKDVHFAIKRSLNSFIWIHSAIRWLPFIYVCRVREIFYSEENGVSNTFNEDIEETTKYLIVPKSIWRKFDCYTYSKLTDSLAVANTVHAPCSKSEQKTNYIVKI